MEYSLEAFETGTRLHSKEFEVYGMAGRSIPSREISDPKVKIRCGKLPTVILAGTPIAFAVQKCRGVPTYRWDRHLGYNMKASPENISVAERVQDVDKIVVVPSREMQADYELQAAEFLEGTMRRAMKNHQRQGTTIPGSDGHAQGKTYKSATSDESAREAMTSMQLIEALGEARDNKMELTKGESLGDKPQRKIRPARRKRENKTDTEGEVAQAIKDAELARSEGAGMEDKMAKLLIQMMWHLKSVSRIRAHGAAWEKKGVKEGQSEVLEVLTASVATEEDSQAIKAVLRQLKTSRKEPDWKRWREKHEDIASVRALALEIENEEDAMNTRSEMR